MEVFVEQPLASVGFANYFLLTTTNCIKYTKTNILKCIQINTHTKQRRNKKVGMMNNIVDENVIHIVELDQVVFIDPGTSEF